jgi:5'-3' exonuclease
MNQQRSRRFRAAQEAKEKAASEEAAWEELTRMCEEMLLGE